VLSSYHWQLQPALSQFGNSDICHQNENQPGNADNKGRLKRVGETDSQDLPKSKKIKIEKKESAAPANTPATPPNLSDALSMLSQMSTEDFQVSPRQIPISPNVPAWLPSENGFSPKRSSWFQTGTPSNNDCDLYSPPKCDSDKDGDQFDLELEIEATAFWYKSDLKKMN